VIKNNEEEWNVNSFSPDVWDVHKPHKTSCTTWFNSVQRGPGIRVRIPPHCTPLTPTRLMKTLTNAAVG
jgi:hypothetical protein